MDTEKEMSAEPQNESGELTLETIEVVGETDNQDIVPGKRLLRRMKQQQQVPGIKQLQKKKEAGIEEGIKKLTEFAGAHKLTDFWNYVKELNKTINTTLSLSKEFKLSIRERIGAICEEVKVKQDEHKEKTTIDSAILRQTNQL